MRLALILSLLFLVTGCKTVEQVLKTAHDLIDIAGKTVEDLADNLDAAKKALEPDTQ